MDNLFNAKEARELATANKRDFDSVIETIRVMAKSSNSYATIRTNEIKEPEEYATKLREMGYNVEVTDFFNITW